MPKQIAFHGLDPLLFGDGRPFAIGGGAGQASSLDMPFPSTVAGALRTLLGNRRAWEFNEANALALMKIAVRGPLLMRDEEFLFRAPADAAMRQLKESDKRGLYRVRPQNSADGGTDLPDGLTLPLEPYGDQFEEKKSPELRWLSESDMERWLSVDADLPEHYAAENDEGRHKPSQPPRDRRAHVGIAFGTQAAGNKLLYQTEGIALGRVFYESEGGFKGGPKFSMVAEIDVEDDLSSGVIALGGERRLSLFGPATKELGCPDSVRKALGQAEGVRMVLATPAVFAEGWKPGWAKDGSMPGCKSLKLRLVSACVPRRQAVSGWDLLRSCVKPVRWLAPAGSTYFFVKESGCLTELADCWLRPVSDLEQDRSDGFGLALWGVWNPSETRS